jgi:hypothetical protein
LPCKSSITDSRELAPPEMKGDHGVASLRLPENIYHFLYDIPT